MNKTETKFDDAYWERQRLIHSEEFQVYAEALCILASTYVERIRKQFADKALEKYSDPTIRRLVLAFGEEAKKQDKHRLDRFMSEIDYGPKDWLTLGDDHCLIHDREYEKAIWFLFDIDKETAG